VLILLASGFWILASPSNAAPSQEDVFKSIQTNLSEPSDPSKLLGVILGGAGLILLLVILSQRRKREVAPKRLNHPGKLMKEIARAVNLKPVDVRQLKALAEDQKVSSPITLLLCPSILARAVKTNARADKRLVSAVVRKIAA
jgi:hypothetical protein